MSSRFRPREEPGLFDDLPLQQDPSSPKPPTENKSSRAEPAADSPPSPIPQPLPLFVEDDEASAVESVTTPGGRQVVSFQTRLMAALVDLGFVLGVMLVVWAGLWLLGIDLDMVDRALVLVFLLPFSFLYQIFPLAFWSCTPGMAKMGIVARSRDGQPLTFSQAARRWLGSLLTVALLGLPLILTASSGRSLSDRLSDSRTQPVQ